MRKRLIFVMAAVSALPAAVSAQSFINETMTITTYYPSPYGVYRNLRLYPSSQPTSGGAQQVGTMYYNSSDDNVYVYKNATGWAALGGGGSGNSTNATFSEPISLKCSWSGSNGMSSCTPQAAPAGYTDLGTGCAGGGISLSSGCYIQYSGYCERWVTKAASSGAAISLKCSWSGSSLGSCTPSACPTGWTSLTTDCAATDVSFYCGSYVFYTGFCERWCTY